MIKPPWPDCPNCPGVKLADNERGKWICLWCGYSRVNRFGDKKHGSKA